ncbi:MAG: hypothetical protein IKG23_02545 [Clostridia bacterium]|nr:hypothetical protein [Clostridia bacterium]
MAGKVQIFYTWIEFRGATKNGDQYTDRGPIWINPALIAGFYDHTILVEGNQIRVMETAEEIYCKLKEV